MSKEHESLVEKYSDKKILGELLGTEIKEIYVEEILYNVFGIKSEKTPDLIAFDSEDNIYVGEIKGRFNTRNKYKAEKQVQTYHNILKRNNIESKRFIICGDYECLFD